MLPLAAYTAKDWSRLRPLTLAYRTAARTRQMRRYQAVPPADMAGFEAMAAKLHGQPLAISIAFNQPWVIDWQQRFIARNMHDLAYMVADNSSIPAQAAEIERLCAERDVPYVRLPGNPGTSASRSHTLALNWVYERVVKPLDPPIFAFLDHDLFPVVPVAPSRDLDGQPFYGRLVEQPARFIEYFIFKPDAHPRLFPNGGHDFQVVVIKGRRQVPGFVFQYRHHHAHFLQLFVGHPQLPQALHPRHLKIGGVVAIVDISHLVGLPVTHAQMGFGGIHHRLRKAFPFLCSMVSALW